MPRPIASDPLHHNLIEDLQGLGFGATMAGLGLHIVAHMGLVTGQTAGLAVIVSHFTAIPFATTYMALSLLCLAIGWRRMGTRFVVKSAIVIVAASGLVAALPRWLELGAILPPVGAAVSGLLFGIAAIAVIRHGGSFGGLSMFWIELQDRTGFRAGHAQLLSDIAIFAVAASFLAPLTLLWSFLSAACFALFVAVNHRRDRYLAR